MLTRHWLRYRPRRNRLRLGGLEGHGHRYLYLHACSDHAPGPGGQSRDQAQPPGHARSEFGKKIRPGHLLFHFKSPVENRGNGESNHTGGPGSTYWRLLRSGFAHSGDPFLTPPGCGSSRSRRLPASLRGFHSTAHAYDQARLVQTQGDLYEKMESQLKERAYSWAEISKILEKNGFQ